MFGFFGHVAFNVSTHSELCILCYVLFCTSSLSVNVHIWLVCTRYLSHLLNLMHALWTHLHPDTLMLNIERGFSSLSQPNSSSSCTSSMKPTRPVLSALHLCSVWLSVWLRVLARWWYQSPLVWHENPISDSTAEPLGSKWTSYMQTTIDLNAIFKYQGI